MKLEEIATAFGTPVFVYDRGRLTDRAEQLKSALQGACELWYAMKANPQADLLRTLAPIVDGLDVSSYGEVQHALTCGFKPEVLSWSAPVKDSSLLRLVAPLSTPSVRISAESAEEAETYVALCTEAGVTPQLSLRLRSPERLHTFGVAHGDEFGMPVDEAVSVLQSLKRQGIRAGLHVHAGSQNRSARGLLRHVSNTLDIAELLEQRADCELDLINFGGGLGVQMSPRQKPLDIDKFCAGLIASIQAFQSSRGPRRFVIEPGRYLVAEAGLYLTRVVRTRDDIAWVDGGVHHLSLASGQHLGAHTEPRTIGIPAGKAHTVRGCSCSPFDLLGRSVSLCPDGLVTVMNAGAYGPTASPQDFLRLPRAQEVVVDSVSDWPQRVSS